jgi:hypothetical protein
VELHLDLKNSNRWISPTIYLNFHACVVIAVDGRLMLLMVVHLKTGEMDGLTEHDY